MKFLGLIAVLITGGLMLLASNDFPDWADSESPANNKADLSQKYVTDTLELTEVPNMVTAVLADYRGFDTMFETVVIFVAGIAIIAVLRPVNHDYSLPQPDDEDPDLIVLMTCRLLIPVIQLFALYVVAHGHHSPGGGFQGGVMLGASFILYALAYGLPKALVRLSEKRAITLAVIGILIYAGFGLATQFLGRNFLDYGVLYKIMPGVETEAWARSHSMLGVEIGVAFTVTAIMFAIYANLSTRGRLDRGL